MRKRINLALALAPLALTLLAVTASAQPSPPQRKDIVGAYYYPWYNASKWTAHVPQLMPTLGHYFTDSLPIVIQHIDSAAYHGIDVLFMSWWNKNDLTDQHLRKGLLRAPNNNKIKFAMLMEPLGDLDSLDGKRDAVVDFNSPAVLKGWIDMFRYFKENFWGHPSYFHIAGKPVVLIYVTRTFLNFGSQHLDSLRAAVGDVYIMADEAFLFSQADPDTARNGIRNRNMVFESYVSYNSYEAAKINPGDSAASYQTRVAMPYYTKWAEKTLFHPPIMPYYRDFRDGHPPLPGSVPAFRDIIKQIRALPMAHPSSDSVNRIYMVTSWNEWFEGTSIESSVENGNKYCQALREAFVGNGSRSRPEVVQVVKESPVRLKSLVKNAYLCVEDAGKGRFTAGPTCDPAGQGFILVDLGHDEVALRDPRTGKYLSSFSDGFFHAMQTYIGTWEIFRLTRQGENVGLQSKKNGAWLRANTDGAGAMVATGTALTTDSYLKLETGPGGMRKVLVTRLP